MWDNYWVNLQHTTNGQLIMHHKQRNYLNVLPDVDISYYCAYEKKSIEATPPAPYIPAELSPPPSSSNNNHQRSIDVNDTNENEIQAEIPIVYPSPVETVNTCDEPIGKTRQPSITFTNKDDVDSTL